MMDQLQGRLEGLLVYDLAECKVAYWAGARASGDQFPRVSI